MIEDEVTQGIRQKVEELNALVSQADDVGFKVEIHVVETERPSRVHNKPQLRVYVWKFLDPNCHEFTMQQS